MNALWNSWYGALFVQDDYRIGSRVTLNLGLRWDVQTPGTDPLNRFVTYVPGQKSTSTRPRRSGKLFYGDPGVERGVIATSGTTSPRGRASCGIRSATAGPPSGPAGGMFYGSISGNEWNTMTNFQPWSTRLTFTNTGRGVNAAGVPQGATLSNPYNNYPGGTPFPYNGSYTVGGGMFGVDLDFDWSYAYQTNVGIQREITDVIGVSASYIGTFNRNLPLGRDVNYPVVTATATNAGANILARRPNPSFGQVLMLDSDQHSNYNGLQLTFNMRKWHNVSANGYYTLSKTMSSAQLHNNTTQGGAQNFTKLGGRIRPRRHRPAPRLQRQRELGDRLLRRRQRLWRGLLNGWSIAPIIKLRSGLPFAITNGNVDANLDGQTNDRAQQVGDPHIDDPTPDRWFNTAAFVQNRVVTGVATDGNSARNLLDGPGFKVVDLAISRSFSLPRRIDADLPRRSHQRVQHRELRAAGQQRPVWRDVDDVRGHPHRQRDAPGSAGRALDVLM